MSEPAAVKIVSHYWAKPIPERKFDWCSCVDGNEEFGPYGYGRTEADAISDLMDQLAND